MLSASSMFPAPKCDRHRVQNVPEPLRCPGGGELDMLGDIPGPCGQWPISLLTNPAVMQVCSLAHPRSLPRACQGCAGQQLEREQLEVWCSSHPTAEECP